jgi:hypothetical protein
MNTEHPKQTKADWEDARRLECNVMTGDKVKHSIFGIGTIMPMLGRHRGFVCVDFGTNGKFEVNADSLFLI